MATNQDFADSSDFEEILRLLDDAIMAQLSRALRSGAGGDAVSGAVAKQDIYTCEQVENMIDRILLCRRNEEHNVQILKN